jgi:membrane protein implicated in regulation of membrane protease activity
VGHRIGSWLLVAVLAFAVGSVLALAAVEPRDRGLSVISPDIPEATDRFIAPPARERIHRPLVEGSVAGFPDLAKLSGDGRNETGQTVLTAADLSVEPTAAHGIGTPTASNRMDSIAGQRQPDWRARLLARIGDPNVAYILLLLGLYGLVYEFANPGTVLPGTVGTVSLLLAVYAFQAIPINLAGLAILALGLGLMITEALIPSVGALGLVGIAAFVYGSLILIETDAPGIRLSLPLVLGSAAISALLLFFIVGLALKVRRHPVVTGSEELREAVGESVAGFPGAGSVHLRGEIWSAHADHAIPPGTPIRVIGRDGLTLLVEPLSDALHEDHPC